MGDLGPNERDCKWIEVKWTNLIIQICCLIEGKERKIRLFPASLFFCFWLKYPGELPIISWVDFFRTWCGGSLWFGGWPILLVLVF